MKNKQINSLKGILMIMIVFYHYTFRFQELYQIETVNLVTLNMWGSLGVAGFFIISGFFIFPKQLDNYSLKTFLKQRILGLYPLYFICLTIIFISIILFGLPNREITLIDYFLNIIMINGYIGTPYIDGAHWYLTYLILFEFIVAIITYIEKKCKVKRNTLLAGWGVFNIITKIISQYFAPFSALNKLLGNKYIFFIMIGILLNEIVKSNKKLAEDKSNIILFIISMIMILYNEGIALFIGICIFILFFVLTIRRKMKFLENKFLTYLGDISYITYLIHQNIGYQILLKMNAISNEYLLIYVLITIIIIIFLSTLIFNFYKKYIQKWINKINYS